MIVLIRSDYKGNGVVLARSNRITRGVASKRNTKREKLLVLLFPNPRSEMRGPIYSARGKRVGGEEIQGSKDLDLGSHAAH